MPPKPKPRFRPLTAQAAGPQGPAIQVGTVAGSHHAGHADGSAATFSSPYAVASGPQGTLYVADTYNHCIRVISAAGVVSTLAGGAAGYANGAGKMARFNTPTGLAVDSAGTVYVADAGNDRIRLISPAGVVSTLAGSQQGFADGTGRAAYFHNPYAVALGPRGILYVADASNNSIRKIALADSVITTLVGGLSSLNRPTGLAVDTAGTVYVADSNNNRICKITPSGSLSTLAGGPSGYADGLAAAARFNHPGSLVLDAAGAVYVSEQGNHRVRIISPQGLVSTLAGSGIATFADGSGAQAAFALPLGLALDGRGALYVADMGNNRIRKVTRP